jgi:hypothetical protein
MLPGDLLRGTGAGVQCIGHTMMFLGCVRYSMQGQVVAGAMPAACLRAVLVCVVPVAGQGRHDNAVVQLQGTQLQGLEQLLSICLDGEGALDAGVYICLDANRGDTRRPAQAGCSSTRSW